MTYRSGWAFCPIHEYERGDCTEECIALRARWKKICHEFQVWAYRYRRKLAVPMPAVRRCPICHTLFEPIRWNQLFCSHECRRREQWIRRYDRLRAA